MHDILIIEDDPFLRKLCAKHLKREGTTVRLAKDGREGMKEIDKEQPDLVLLDLLMPHVDGFAVLKHIQEKGYAFPVIVLSNVVWNLDKEACKKIGITDYFIKSNVDIPMLVQGIERHLPPEKAK
jgi:DNA-binding response OmpR family regulator